MSSSDEDENVSMSSIDEDEAEDEEDENEDDDDSDLELEFKHFVFFLTDQLETMHFVVLLKKKEEEERICTLIEKHYGFVTTNLSEFGPHSIVLVDDNALTWKHDKDVFKVSYVDQCVNKGMILDITKFLKDKSKDFAPYFNFMKIVYFRQYSWAVVPPEFRLKEKPLRLEAKSLPTKTARGPPYTRREKEAILTYISKNFCTTGQDTLKGVSLWKDMERKNICDRTWQSMKEHFLKSILKQLDSFDCISGEDARTIRHAMK